MKKTKIISAMAAMAVTLTLGSCVNYKKLMDETPADYIANSFENSIKAIAAKDSFGIKNQIESALENGSIEFDVYDEDITYSVVSNYNKKSTDYSADFNMASKNGSDLSISVGKDSENIYFSKNGESGNESYYININDFESDFEDSIFYYTSDSWYSFSEEECDYIIEAVKGLAENSDDNKVKKELMKVFNKLDHTFETNAAQIGSENVNANIITFELDEDEMSDLLNDIADILSDVSVDTYDIEDIAKEIAETSSKLTLSFYINSKTHSLMMVEGKLKIGDGDYSVTASAEVFFGKDPKKTDEYYVKVKMSDGYDKISAELTLSDSESSKDNTVWNATLKFNGDGENINIKGSVEYDKKSGDYEASLRIPIDGDTSKISVSGKITSNKSSAEITAEKMSASFDDEKIDLSAAVKFSDKNSSTLNKSKNENFLDISEDEFEVLGESIGEDIAQVASDSLDSSLSGYVNQSRLTQMQANAKNVHTATTAKVAQDYADGYDFYYIPTGGVVSSGGPTATKDGKTLDLTNGLGNEFKGYFYVYIDEGAFAVTGAMWSDKPISDECIQSFIANGYGLTEEEQIKYGVGSFPIAY